MARPLTRAFSCLFWLAFARVVQNPELVICAVLFGSHLWPIVAHLPSRRMYYLTKTKGRYLQVAPGSKLRPISAYLAQDLKKIKCDKKAAYVLARADYDAIRESGRLPDELMAMLFPTPAPDKSFEAELDAAASPRRRRVAPVEQAGGAGKDEFLVPVADLLDANDESRWHPSHGQAVHGPFDCEILTENVYVARRSREDQEPYRCCCKAPAQTCQKGQFCSLREMYVECTPHLCKHGAACGNQRLQRHEHAPVEVFQTRMKGLGLRALAAIDDEDLVLEYVGEVISVPEFNRRKRVYEKDDTKHFYFFELTQGQHIIDATVKGGIARFINHSCDPNCQTIVWEVGSERRVGIQALRRIEPGEEITYDYEFERYGSKAQACYCGAANCRRVICAPAEIEAAKRLRAEAASGISSAEPAASTRPPAAKRKPKALPSVDAEAPEAAAASAAAAATATATAAAATAPAPTTQARARAPKRKPAAYEPSAQAVDSSGNDGLRAQLAAAALESDGLRSQLAAAAREADDLRSQLAAAVREADGLRNELAAAAREADGLRAQLATPQAAVARRRLPRREAAASDMMMSEQPAMPTIMNFFTRRCESQ